MIYAPRDPPTKFQLVIRVCATTAIASDVSAFVSSRNPNDTAGAHDGPENVEVRLSTTPSNIAAITVPGRLCRPPVRLRGIGLREDGFTMRIMFRVRA